MLSAAECPHPTFRSVTLGQVPDLPEPRPLPLGEAGVMEDCYAGLSEGVAGMVRTHHA